MKILCTVPSYWPAFQFGGPITSVHGLNNALVKKGVEVCVYTTNVGLHGMVPINRRVCLHGVKIWYFNTMKLPQIFSAYGWQYSIPLRAMMKRFISSFDLVYNVGIWEYPNLAACYYCRKYKIPFVLSPRGVLRRQTFNSKLWKKQLYYNLVFLQLLPKNAALHYSSEEELQDSVDCMPANAHKFVVGNGIDLSQYNNCIDNNLFNSMFPGLKNKQVVLFLGRIHWVKGLDILIDAFAQVVRSINDIHLMIIGNDENGYSNRLNHLIREHDLRDCVTLQKALIGKEKIAILKKSSMLVMPSYSESFGMSALEAMACRKPVILTRAVPLSHYVEKANAGIVVSINAAQIAEAIKTISIKRTESCEMGDNGYLLVSNIFNWDRIADNMIDSFETVIRENKS